MTLKQEKASADSSPSPAVNASIASSDLDFRPIQVKTEDGIVKISHDKGITWTNYDRSKTRKSDVKDSNDVIPGPILDYAKEGLEALAKLTDIPMLEFGVGTIFDSIFQSPDNSDIESALDDINSQLSQIKDDIINMFNQLQNSVKQAQLKEEIDLYINDIKQYEVVSDNFALTLVNINKEPDGSQKEQDELNFLAGMYSSQVNGNDFCSAVQGLSKDLTDISSSSGTDLFGTFDQLALYTYNWEHQGYDARRSFQASALGLFVPLAALAMESLSVAVQENLPPNSSGFTPAVQYQSLLNDLVAVLNMANNEAVVERPGNQRYYQTPGHECLLADVADARQVAGSFPANWQGSEHSFKNQAISQFVNLFTNQSLGVANTNPSADWLNSVYSDYKSTSTLWNIFFSSDQGNITQGNNVAAGAGFITNDQRFDWQTYPTFFMKTDATFTENTTIIKNSSDPSDFTKVDTLLADGDYSQSENNSWEYDNEQKGVYFIGLAVLNMGRTEIDFVPERTEKPAGSPVSGTLSD